MTKKRKKKKSRIYIIWLMNLCLTIAVIAFFVWHESVPDVSPENALKTYMAHILNREYEQMYEMIDAGTSGNISKEDFVKRNSAIYEGIGVDNMKVHITSYDKEQKLFTMDEYGIEYHHFEVHGYDIEVKTTLIAEALKELTERKRNVILLSYFMEMSDADIAREMNLVRSTIHEHRTRSLEILRKIMEGIADEKDV